MTAHTTTSPSKSFIGSTPENPGKVYRSKTFREFQSTIYFALDRFRNRIGEG